MAEEKSTGFVTAGASSSNEAFERLVRLRKELLERRFSSERVAEAMGYNASYIRRLEAQAAEPDAEARPIPECIPPRYEEAMLQALVDSLEPARRFWGTEDFAELLARLRGAAENTDPSL